MTKNAAQSIVKTSIGHMWATCCNIDCSLSTNTLSRELNAWDTGLIFSSARPKSVFLSEVAKNKDGASRTKTIMRVVIMLFFDDLNLAEIVIETNETPTIKSVP